MESETERRERRPRGETGEVGEDGVPETDTVRETDFRGDGTDT